MEFSISHRVCAYIPPPPPLPPHVEPHPFAPTSNLAETGAPPPPPPLPKGMSEGAGAKCRRVYNPNDVLEAGGYVRIHASPKRFPAAHALDAGGYAKRILREDDDFVIVDKPQGVQVVSRVDNAVENLAYIYAGIVGTASPLHPCHRLDEGTAGVVVLAKTSAGARAFGLAMEGEERPITKEYRALCVAPPPLCRLVHYMARAPRAAGERERMSVFDAPREGAVEARLSVESASVVGDYHEVVVRLETGRTHQIRAQLAHVGCALVGDDLYNERPHGSSLGLHAYRLSFSCSCALARLGTIESRAAPWWRAL